VRRRIALLGQGMIRPVSFWYRHGIFILFNLSGHTIDSGIREETLI